MDVCETGTCTYVVKWVVHTQTSGNELRGRDEHWGDFPRELDAKIALANSPQKFTNGEWGWRAAGGYTTARITRVITHTDYKPTEAKP